MATYRYIKWEITKKYGTGNGIIQVGELQLKSGGYDVAWNGSVLASNPGGDNPVGEIPQNAVDGTAAAKWLDLNFSGGSNVGSSVLIVDNSVDITFDSYYYVTAVDSTLYSDRNPISWTLYGSSDGSNWTALHSANDVTIPNADETPTTVYNLVELTPTPTSTPTATPSPTPTIAPTSTPTPTATQPLYELSLSPVLQGNIPFGLGLEYITPSSDYFTPGQKIWLNASQQFYSFDYYEVYYPAMVVESYLYYTTPYGFTASFDPRTQVQLNTSSDIVGNNSIIIARYRA